ncbi:MAG: negative regulator of flagellin synthesis FlgM [Clostridiales bacterium]|jgi:negative regulator of flagellin synthesis FlgM|nr:negative regulator of flagellin synthesis FlgM [Clostridiales bacterium]MDK2934101.1 negative regulator of flagellin synthesis FlgM [Clostridiales bacterium]
MMRIPGDFSKIIGVYNKNKNVAKINKNQGIEGKKDTITLSNQAKDYQVALKALRQVPDIREEKVRELAQRYADGTYNVSGKDVAEKLVNRFFDKKA